MRDRGAVCQEFTHNVDMSARGCPEQRRPANFIMTPKGSALPQQFSHTLDVTTGSSTAEGRPTVGAVAINACTVLEQGARDFNVTPPGSD